MKKTNTAIFQIDPLEKLNHKTDSSIFLIKEALKSGVDVWISLPSSLTYFDKQAFVYAYRILDLDLSVSQPMRVSIKDFMFFFIRQDPPFDINYLTNCYILELHQRSNKSPFFINNPSAIKNFTEKIFPFYFQDLTPKTYLTANPLEFKKVLKKFKIAVIKKLYNKGGEDVYKVSLDDPKSLDTFKKCSSNFSEALVVQEYMDEVIFGDKRVILVDGIPQGAVNRVPRRGEFKANLHLGAKADRTELTLKEKQICNSLENTLKKNKLFLVGIDIINEKLTEINVTSPTGLVQISRLEKKNLATIIWKKLLKKSTL